MLIKNWVLVVDFYYFGIDLFCHSTEFQGCWTIFGFFHILYQETYTWGKKLKSICKKKSFIIKGC